MLELLDFISDELDEGKLSNYLPDGLPIRPAVDYRGENMQVAAKIFSRSSASRSSGAGADTAKITDERLSQLLEGGTN